MASMLRAWPEMLFKINELIGLRNSTGHYNKKVNLSKTQMDKIRETVYKIVGEYQKAGEP